MVNIKALMTLWIRDWFKLFEHKKMMYKWVIIRNWNMKL